MDTNNGQAQQQPAGNPAGNQPSSGNNPGAAGAAAPGTGGGTQPGANPDGQPAGAGGGTNAADVYRPDGLPDHLVGANNNETIDKLYKAFDGYRKDASTNKPPKSPADYKFDFGDKADGILQLDENGTDPMLENWKGIFHENGVSNDTAQNIILGVFESIQGLQAAGGGNTEGLDFDFEGIGGAAAAKPVQDGVKAWAQGLKNTGRMTDEDIAEIDVLSGYRQGLNLLSKIRELTGEKPIPLDNLAAGAEGEVTEELVNQRVADPRYQRGHPDFDQTFHDETTKMFQQLYNQA